MPHMAYIGTGRDIMPKGGRPKGIMSLPVPIFAMWQEGLDLLHDVEDRHFKV